MSHLSSAMQRQHVNDIVPFARRPFAGEGLAAEDIGAFVHERNAMQLSFQCMLVAAMRPERICRPVVVANDGF